MKNISFNQMNGDKVMENLQDYINGLNKTIENLRDRVNHFNKDEEIQKLKKENDKIRSNSLLIMSEKEKLDAKSFSEEHYKTCKANSIYILEGTGIGTSIIMKCKKCNGTKNITDMDNW